MAATAFKLFVLSACVLGVFGDDELHRPCNDSDDVNACVGQWLAAHSSCSADSLPDSATYDPYPLGNFYMNLPWFNTTEDRTNVELAGLAGASIKDFFQNTTSNQAVLTFYIPSHVDSGIRTINFQIPGREYFKVTASYKISYSGITITVIFPDSSAAELSSIYAFAELPTLATVENGPELAAAAENNALVADQLEARVTYSGVAGAEGFAYKSPVLAKLFINKVLCGYPEKVASNSDLLLTTLAVKKPPLSTGSGPEEH